MEVRKTDAEPYWLTLPGIHQRQSVEILDPPGIHQRRGVRMNRSSTFILSRKSGLSNGPVATNE